MVSCGNLWSVESVWSGSVTKSRETTAISSSKQSSSRQWERARVSRNRNRAIKRQCGAGPDEKEVPREQLVSHRKVSGSREHQMQLANQAHLAVLLPVSDGTGSRNFLPWPSDVRSETTSRTALRLFVETGI